MATPKRKYQSKYRPDNEKHQRVDLNSRDLMIFQEILEDRFLTIDQIQQLFFSSYKVAALRLQKLWNQGYLKRQFLSTSRGSQPTLYCLQKKTYDLLVENGMINPEEISWEKIKNQQEISPEKRYHEIDCNQFKIALWIHLNNHHEQEIEMIHFGHGPAYWDYTLDPENQKKKIPIRPDRVMALKIKEVPETFFLELDRGTMTLERFRTKIRGYRHYYYSKGFYKRYGDARQPFEKYGYRVLTITTSKLRRNNLLNQALKEKSYYMCWFTTLEEATNNPLNKVWMRGKEYKEVLEILPGHQRNLILSGDYRSGRDKMIEEKVLKLNFFKE